MKVLFACRDYLPKVGGLQRSVNDLARRLPDPVVYTLLDPSAGKLRCGAARVARRLSGREVRFVDEVNGVPVWRTRSIAGLPAVLERVGPDAVVVNAGAAYTHPFVRAALDLVPPSILRCLYVRDEASAALPTEVDAEINLANCEHIARLMRTYSRRPVHVVPSIVEPVAPSVERGSHVLFVNPVLDRGLALAIEIAEHLPSEARWADLRRRTAHVRNVELRRATSPDLVYEGARLMLVPYLVPNRPRVVLEAMAASVPVIGMAGGGVEEALGGAGVAIVASAGVDAWTHATRRLVVDHSYHADLVCAGLRRLRAPDAEPDLLARRFVDLLEAGRPT
jgi:glycosyltransferase involved in cell wall biosynthesis